VVCDRLARIPKMGMGLGCGKRGPTVLALEPGETGLPGTSYLKGHLITTLPKARLRERQARTLSGQRMRQVCELVRRSFDPDAPYEPRRT